MIHQAFAIGSPQHRMIVCLLCYDCYDRFQQIPFGDFSREGLTGSKVGVKFCTRIGGSCLGLLQTKTMLNINEEKLDLSNVNGENKTSCVVIGGLGHPAGRMQSVFQLRRMIVCCELYDWFLQIPFGEGVEHSFYLFMLLRLLFKLLKFFCFIKS
jgi:hypothetical protein